GTPVGEHDKRDRALLQSAEHFNRTRQHLVATKRTVAEQQRAVEIEHEALDGRQRFERLHFSDDRTHDRGTWSAARPCLRISSLNPDFATEMYERSRCSLN